MYLSLWFNRFEVGRLCSIQISDVMMNTMASQITSLTIVYSIIENIKAPRHWSPVFSMGHLLKTTDHVVVAQVLSSVSEMNSKSLIARETLHRIMFDCLVPAHRLTQLS